MMYLRHGGSRTEKLAIGQEVFLVGVIIPKSKKSFCFPCQRARLLRLYFSKIQTYITQTKHLYAPVIYY